MQLFKGTQTFIKFTFQFRFISDSLNNFLFAKKHLTEFPCGHRKPILIFYSLRQREREKGRERVVNLNICQVFTTKNLFRITYFIWKELDIFGIFFLYSPDYLFPVSIFCWMHFYNIQMYELRSLRSCKFTRYLYLHRAFK